MARDNPFNKNKILNSQIRGVPTINEKSYRYVVIWNILRGHFFPRFGPP